MVQLPLPLMVSALKGWAFDNSSSPLPLPSRVTVPVPV